MKSIFYKQFADCLLAYLTCGELLLDKKHVYFALDKSP